MELGEGVEPSRHTVYRPDTPCWDRCGPRARATYPIGVSYSLAVGRQCLTPWMLATQPEQPAHESGGSVCAVLHPGDS